MSGRMNRINPLSGEHLAEHDAELNTLADKVNAMPGKDAIHVLEVNLANIRETGAHQ